MMRTAIPLRRVHLRTWPPAILSLRRTMWPIVPRVAMFPQRSCSTRPRDTLITTRQRCTFLRRISQQRSGSSSQQQKESLRLYTAKWGVSQYAEGRPVKTTGGLLFLRHIAFFRGSRGKQLFGPCLICFAQTRRISLDSKKLSVRTNFRRAWAQHPTTRIFSGSLWYPWYPSACSQPKKPCRKCSACSAFLVGWYSYSTTACFAQPLVRYSHI